MQSEPGAPVPGIIPGQLFVALLKWVRFNRVMTSGATEARRRTDAWFVTTHWSVVLHAARRDTTRAGEALARLCETYWYPLYAYVRRRGHSPHDAQDLTQTFFASLLERQSIATVDPNRGRFRSFLLGAMNHFLANEWKRVNALKRSGGRQVVSLDLNAAEERFELEPATQDSPDKAFDREWASALLSKVLDRLEEEFRRDGKEQLFSELKQTLAGPRESQPYLELAARLNMSEGAVKTAVHRLRKRYRQLLEAEIANTVGSPAEVKEELTYLFRAIS